MCDSIRFQGIDRKIGSLVITSGMDSGRIREAIWSGIIKPGRVDWWNKQGDCLEVYILADSFYFDWREYLLSDQRILGRLLRKDVVIGKRCIAKAGTVKMLIRPAATYPERSISYRWPITVSSYIQNRDL